MTLSSSSSFISVSVELSTQYSLGTRPQYSLAKSTGCFLAMMRNAATPFVMSLPSTEGSSQTLQRSSSTRLAILFFAPRGRPLPNLLPCSKGGILCFSNKKTPAPTYRELGGIADAIIRNALIVAAGNHLIALANFFSAVSGLLAGRATELSVRPLGGKRLAAGRARATVGHLGALVGTANPPSASEP